MIEVKLDDVCMTQPKIKEKINYMNAIIFLSMKRVLYMGCRKHLERKNFFFSFLVTHFTHAKTKRIANALTMQTNAKYSEDARIENKTRNESCFVYQIFFLPLTIFRWNQRWYNSSKY